MRSYKFLPIFLPWLFLPWLFLLNILLRMRLPLLLLLLRAKNLFLPCFLPGFLPHLLLLLLRVYRLPLRKLLLPMARRTVRRIRSGGRALQMTAMTQRRDRGGPARVKRGECCSVKTATGF